jgi:outer membrane receptor protein involved in Fe transport
MRIAKFGAAFLLAGTSMSAMAQTEQPAAETEASADDVIIVTARKREENLQDVPLTISVTSADTIEKAKLNNVSDLASQTPGFSYKQGFGRIGGGGGAGVRPSIRGMSSVVGAPNAAFFVDGVFVSDNIASYQLENLERVEVIKGPQSALFGRQTFSGAVNYVTRKPSNTFTGKVKLTLAEYNSSEVSGYVSGPIVKDLLAFEINARRYEFGGDYKNGDISQTGNLGAQRSYNIGGRLLFTPSDNFEALASVGYSKDRDNGYVYGFQGSAKNNCFAPPIVATIPFPRTNTNRRGFYCGEVSILPQYTYNDREIEDAGFHALDRKFLRTSLSMTASTDSGWSLTSITAYNRNNSITGQDNTLLPTLTAAFAVDQARTKDFSQEIRVMSPQDQPIRGLFGGYYYKDDVLQGFQYTNTNRTRRTFDSADGVRSKSVFGMIEADIGDTITLGAEARYQSETILGSTEVLAPVGTNNATPPPPTGLRRAKFNAFLPRFSARWEPTETLTLHATAAKGNKPGGFNSFPVDAIAADIASFTAQGFDIFDEETAWSYEIGAKGRFADVINYSVAGFYTDWTSQQLSRGESYTRTSGTPNSVVFIQNAGASEIKGFEFDLSGKPADWLFLRFGYTYVDARFTEFYDDTTEEIYDTDGRPGFLTNDTRNPADLDNLEGDVSGNKLPQTPTHQFIATAQVTAPLSGSFDFFARGDLAYESKRYSQVDNLNWAGDSYNLNVSLGLENDNWSLTFFARNLLNDKTPLVVTRLLDFNRLLTRVNPFTGLNQTTFFRDFAVSAPRKQQFGVTLGYNF